MRIRRAASAAHLVFAVLVLSVSGLAGCGDRDASVAGPQESLSEQQQAAWRKTHGASHVTIAVVDGGVDARHPALQGVVEASWVARGLEGGPTEHGTQVAGIVAGLEVHGYSGGLAKGARVLEAKALDSDGTGLPADIAEALHWAGGQGADMVVTSFGLEVDDPRVRRAIARLAAHGVFVVAATGNGYGDLDMYPASYPKVVGATAYDKRGKRLDLANWRGADLAAPGQGVWPPALGGGYAAVSGTSVAAAVAAGLIASCDDHHPLTTDDELRPGCSAGHVSTPNQYVPKVACP